MNRAATLPLVLALWVTPPLLAHGTVDQANVWLYKGNAYWCAVGGSMFQSFRPSVSPLIGVDLFMRDYTPGPDLVTIRIRSGTPSGPVLATVKAGLEEGVAHFDLPSPINTFPDAILVIEWVDPPGLDLAWLYNKDTYRYGTAFGCSPPTVIPGTDFYFRTYTGGRG